MAKIEKKQESSDPEVKHEPKGPRGRPRSESRPPTGRASGSGNQQSIDTTTDMAILGKNTIVWLLDQLKLRGFQDK